MSQSLKRIHVLLAALIVATLPMASAPAQTAETVPDTRAKLQALAPAAAMAVSADATEAGVAIAKLREAGRYGMIALDMAHESALRSAYSKPARKLTPEWKRLSLAFEKVGAQRDNWASSLYWYTDLTQAMTQARKENKPVLSLRLMGNLDDELSCANSRFFRTALYPDLSIRMFLQQHYILHWQSVRPVPKVTIDFGDGRKIETTVTGNSIHYILDKQGRVLDALPGLYGPQAFFKWIERGLHLSQHTAKREGAAFDDYLRQFHNERLAQITRDWQTDVGQLKLASVAPSTPPKSHTNVPAITGSDDAILFPIYPTARQASTVPVTKAVIERPLERVMVSVPRDRETLARKTDDALWEKIAELHAHESRLDNHSLDLLRTKTSRAKDVVLAFEKSLAQDSVRNEYIRHATLHQWLEKTPSINLDALNERVYAEMFLTPNSDPWIGLLPVEAYAALPNDGVVTR